MAPDSDEEDECGNEPAFIDMSSAVEVDIPDANSTNNGADDDTMMHDVDAHALPSKLPPMEECGVSTQSSPVTIDQSKVTFNPHTDAIYAIASHYDADSHRLLVASGGGDDRAFLHHVTTTLNAELSQSTTPLMHQHTDSVSCAAFNAPYIDSDLSGKRQRSVLAVGSCKYFLLNHF